MEESDFINIYIQTLLNELIETTKTKVLLQSQLQAKDKDVQEFNELKNKFEQALNETNEKLREANNLLSQAITQNEYDNLKSELDKSKDAFQSFQKSQNQVNANYLAEKDRLLKIIEEKEQIISMQYKQLNPVIVRKKKTD
jgi:predicted  nucleic acid-binding Zn-ribbon protein